MRKRKINSSEATPNIKEINDDMRLNRDAEFVLRNLVNRPRLRSPWEKFKGRYRKIQKSATVFILCGDS